MKNIITISGEPVSGKGTVVKKLKEYFKENGYNVHVISVGHLFREISLDMYKKEHPEIENPTIEQVNNDERFSDKRREIDLNIDSYIAKVGREVNEIAESKDVYIFDSRLAFDNIENSFAVRLTVDEKIAGERVFNDHTRGKEDEYETVEQAIESTKKRKEGEIARYKERYGVDLTDENNYDLVINTSFAYPEEIMQTIVRCFEYKKSGKYFAKTWASPKWFLPLQGIRETCRPAGMGLSLEEFEQLIKKEGYRPNSPIKVIQVDGYYYIIEGHHRNFAAGVADKTLIPYDLLAKDDEEMGYSQNTARDRVYSMLKEDYRNTYLSRYVYDHEDCLNTRDANGKKLEQFFYTQVYADYPRIPQKENDGQSKIEDEDPIEL